MFNEVLNVLKSKWVHVGLVMLVAALPAGVADAGVVVPPLFQAIFTLVAAAVTVHGTQSYVKETK